MITHLGGALHGIANIVHLMFTFTEALEKTDAHTLIMRKRDFDGVGSSLVELNRVSAGLTLDATLHSIDYALKVLNRGHVDEDGDLRIGRSHAERLVNAFDAIRTNFLAQMASKVTISLPSRHASYLAKEDCPYGRDVEDAFPEAGEDILEAARCLALGRSTAVVFHLMRAMEAAVQKIASRLLIEKIDVPWGVLLSELDKKIGAMPKGNRRDNWSELHTLLFHVKQAWRNDTMHPKRTYTDAQAEAVFNAVHTFMANLALVLSEEA